MDWKAFKDKILVRPISSEETVGGIILQSNKKKGIAVSVGQGTEDEPMAVTEGQNLIYDAGDGVPITLEGEQYVILRERDVWMIK